MPWTPLPIKLRRHADRLRKTRKIMREACWAYKRETLAREHKLGFFARLKFYHRASK